MNSKYRAGATGEPLVAVDSSEGIEDFDYEPVEDADTEAYLPDGHVPTTEGFEEEPAGQPTTRTRGRALAFPGSLLMLALVFGAVVWLLAGRATGGTNNSGNSAYEANSYAIRDAGSDITGLGTGPKVGSLAPDFELKDLNTGQSVRLSSFKGKPVWINFWASWCPPCKAELPDIKQEYAKYRGEGLVILGVDMREDPAVVKQFTTDNGYDWTFAIDGDGQVTDKYFVFSIPTHIFVGRDGVIEAMQIGGIPGALMEEYLAKIMKP